MAHVAQVAPALLGALPASPHRGLGRGHAADAVMEVVAVEAGILRGHSRLGPVSAVTSRTRHGDGRLYEEKTTVQHRLTGTTPSCVIYSSDGVAYPSN
jgi:hypothetical protein